MMRLLFSAIVVAAVLHVASFCGFGQEKQARLWKDASGSFQVSATLVERTAATVRLHTADGREISVPINRLSQADQEYLRSLDTPKDNPFAGGEALAKPNPEIAPAPAALAGTLRAKAESRSAGEELALPDTGETKDLNSPPVEKPFAPDPEPNAPAIPAGIALVSPVDAYDKIGGPVLAGGGVCLVSIGRNKSGAPQETRGRIYSVNLATKDVKLVWDHPRAVRVLDHDERTGRTLIIDKLDQFQRGGELLMVEGLATGAPQTLYRRTLPGAGKPGFAPQVEWAALLSGSHVAAIMDRSLLVWDLPAAKLLYRVSDVLASEPPVFSGNQFYMAIPQSGKVVVVETATGTVRRSIATGSTLRPGAAFHPDGRMLALCYSNQFHVWDCVDEAIVSEATTTDHLGSHPINWIAPNMFRAALGDAVHMGLGMSVWKYSASLTTPPVVEGDKLLAATTSRECAVVSVPIPHAASEKSIVELLKAGDAAMLMRPGSEVALAVDTAVEGVNQEEIKTALAKAAEKAGWKVSEKAPVTLVAKIGRGETRQLKFHSLGGGNRTESTANLTPFTAALEIRQGATVLWTRTTENRIPPILRLEEGETVQDAVKRYEKPDSGFFSLLTLPPRILKPAVSEKLGRSTLKDGQWQDSTAGVAPAGPRRRP